MPGAEPSGDESVEKRLSLCALKSEAVSVPMSTDFKMYGYLCMFMLKGQFGYFEH